MSKPLKEIVKEIQYRTDFTLDEIADKVGYSPGYFRNEVSKGVNKNIAENLRAKFNEIISHKSSKPIETPQAMVNEQSPVYAPGRQSESLLREIITLKDQIIAMQTKENNSLQSQINALKEITKEINVKVEGCNLLIQESNQLSKESNMLMNQNNGILKSLEGLAELAKVARAQDPSEHPKSKKGDGKHSRL